jgi:hypothetical protein
MKKLTYASLLCGFLANLTILCAQVAPNNSEDLYSALTIPKELLPNANVIIRQYDLSFTVKNIGEAIEKEHKVVTILNEKGEDYASPVFAYGKITDIDDIEAVFYDALGTPIRKLKKKDISDFKPFTDDVTDVRAKQLNFPHRAYPYTVEYTVTTKHNGLMFYPVWRPQEDNNEAIQHASFEITMPPTMELHYKEMNLNKGVQKLGQTFRWDIKDVKAFASEGFTPSVSRYLPAVWTASKQFEIEGFKGNMESWESLGKFIQQLNKGRKTLSDSKIASLKRLVADCTDDACKVERIYKHLQETTRYYSIQLGIGGWQPIAAESVDKNKYSDCKGLSNYMLAMLEAVGIQGNYVVIRAGHRQPEQLPDFPNMYFNHAIACVPLKNDTIWLECTSQNVACGFMSDFTDDRLALVVSPEGGKLVRTPHYDAKANTIRRMAEIALNTEGSATATYRTTHSGNTQNSLSQLLEKGSDEQKKELYEQLKINNLDIKTFNYKQTKSRIPTVEGTLEMSIEKLASVSGKRLFVPVNVFSKWTRTPAPDSTRRFEVQADDDGFTELDSVTFTLPEGYKMESRPDPLSIQSPFGSFEMNLKVEAQKVVIYRRLVVNNAILPKEKFSELVDFFRNVAKADKGKMVLVKTT